MPLSLALPGALLVAALGGLGGWALGARRPEEAPPVAVPTTAPTAADVEPLAMPEHVRAIVVGGGPAPSANEVQLEDDLLLAREVLGDEGLVMLYAGGPGTRAVRIEDGSAPEDELVDGLATLFAEHSSRGSTFRPTRLAVHGPATLDHTLAILEAARTDVEAGPLLFYFAGHGAGGDDPLSSTAFFWGGEELDPDRLLEVLDGPFATEGEPDEDTHGSSEDEPEPLPEDLPTLRAVRFVFTSCFSGGFATLAFHATPDDRCGFFATSWSREASGCAADPDRAAQEGYGIHFLSALAGHARDGSDARAEIDLDGDGTITLSEAHARARIASRSIDVPTTTSAWMLEEWAHHTDEPAPPIAWPEEEAVRRALGEALDVGGRDDAWHRQTEAETRRNELERRRDEIADEELAAWAELTGPLLSRWPVLDDPWHADWRPTLERDGDAILAAYETSPARLEWEEARDELDRVRTDLEALDVELALLQRWIDADDDLARAAALAAESPSEWAEVAAVIACERTPP